MKSIKKFFTRGIKSSKKTLLHINSNPSIDSSSSTGSNKAAPDDCLDTPRSVADSEITTSTDCDDSEAFDVDEVYQTPEVLAPSPVTAPSSVPKLDLSTTTTTSARVLRNENATSAHARKVLIDTLSNGLVITRHYLNEKPERKKLICNPTMSTLMCQPLESAEDELRIVDILELRRGDEIEQQYYNSQSPKTVIGFVNTFFLNEKVENKSMDDVLQKSCRPEKLRLCFSLVCADRTVDIQCFSNKDYKLLVNNLSELIGVTPPLSPRPSSTSRLNSPNGSIRSIMSKSSVMSMASRKSVKFTDDVSSLARTDSVSSFSDEEAALSHVPGGIVYLHGEDYDSLLHQTNAKQIPARRKRMKYHSPTPSITVEKGRSPMTPPVSPDKRMGKLLTYQQNCFGTNMYSSLKPEDEVVLHMLMRQGMHEEEAVQHLFERRYLVNKTLEPVAAPASNNTSTSSSSSSSAAVQKPQHKYRMSEENLSELMQRQDRNFGANMFDSITDSDEMKIQRMLTLGYAYDEAALAIFKEKVNISKPSHYHTL